VGIISSNKNSLRTELVYLKDAIPHNHKSTVVYHAPCAGKINDPCTATFIGEMERSMHIRLREHHNKVTLPLSNKYASALGQHARTTDHHFRPEDITYLVREGNRMAHGIKEAIYTRALDPPSTGEVDCNISSPTVTTASSQPPYAHRNLHRPVLQAPLHPLSTSMTLDPKADRRNPATASCASPWSTPPSPWPRPPRSLRKPPFLPQQPRAAPAALERTLPPWPPGPPLPRPLVPPRLRRHQPT
jgi:hypothetical protein